MAASLQNPCGDTQAVDKTTGQQAECAVTRRDWGKRHHLTYLCSAIVAGFFYSLFQHEFLFVNVSSRVAKYAVPVQAQLGVELGDREE